MKFIALVRKSWGMSAALLLLACCPNNATAQDADNWQFEAILYGWYSGVDGTVKYPGGPGSGGDIAVDASDIVENMNMILMGGFHAKKNRWSIVTDLIYLNADDDANSNLTVGPGSGVPVNASVGMDITTWIVSGGIGYDLVQNERWTLALIGGARYLAADVDVTMDIQGPLPFARPPAEKSGSADLLDGFVGLRGALMLSGNWYIPYHFDVGAGDSDLTWQAFAGLGYRFGWGDVRLGYRYLSYEMDDDMLLQELEMSGPILGLGFRF